MTHRPALLFAALTAALVVRGAMAGEPRTPGPQRDGSVILPNQWSLRPAGRQIEVGDFPTSIAMHPDGRHAAVLHCGHGPHEVVIIDVAAGKVVSRTAVDEAFYGLAFDAGGTMLFVSGSGDEVIRRFRFESGALVPEAALPLRDRRVRGVPAGIAVTRDGSRLYAVNLWGQSVSRIDLGRAAAADAVADLPLAVTRPTAPPPAPATTDDPSITKRSEQALEPADASRPFPYACVLDEPRGRLYVSLWALAAVAVIDLREWREVARWPVEEHPNEMLLAADGRRLFVANANRNSVSVIDPDTGVARETLVATLRPDDAAEQADAPPGNTPNALALSADGRRLFVANANINTVAVFDVAEPGRSRSLGFIPVGWYPTSVRLAGDGRTLVVANGKGVISDSNRNGPRPGFDPGTPTPDYIGRLFQGTVTLVELPAEDEAFTTRMAEWTRRAYACRPPVAAVTPGAGHPIPRDARGASPITHVLYIVKENRTYDQVLGDMPEGRGDPSLCLFPETVTPNHHALAREFVLLDNFYVESEVSADGHEWSMGAYASDFVEKQWPLSYGHDRKKFPYPAEGGFDAAARPAGGYLWDRAIAAGVSVRSYGEWIDNGPEPDGPGRPKTPALEGRFDPLYRGFDMRTSDLKRADRLIAEIERFSREGEMPRLQIIRLPNDHTSGASPGLPTPTAYVAENDLALGRIVEAVSRSRFWPTTAIFVVEDDAQNGSDHIDAHRTVAFCIGPHVRRRTVDSTLYSTSSMLRTIELILGLEPMSQFDAAAMPMHACFQPEAVLDAYACRPAGVPLDERNAATAWGAAASLAMDFSREDAADDLLLNEIVWRSVRGPAAPMPPPRRAAFVFAADEDEDDEDDDEEN